MCGIAGLVATPGERPDEAALRRMTGALAHRGPDADGYLLDDNVGLGHRRLTILDLRDVANQPLYSEDRAVALIFNGEIYNYLELVPELEARGHRFTTRTDSEVLVHGWEEWGEDLVRRLRGMYAFALWDRKKRVLFAARDRAGKKPFYYGRGGQGFAFASEIGPLLDAPGLSRELDLAAVGEYFVYGNTVQSRSVYRDVRRLPPGCTLTVSADDPTAEPKIHRYWRYEPHPDRGLDRAEWLEELDRRLHDAVRLRLLSDVPLGAFLSGGIDSSLIVALMAQHAPERVKTFAIGFREEDWDESAHARAVADHLGTEHAEEIVTQDAVALLPELVDAYDEPFADPSAIPTWHLSRMTRKHVTVALSGDGGDELFYGYQRYVDTAKLRRWGSWITPVGRMLARGAARALPVDSWTGRGLDRASRREFRLYHHAMGFSRPFLSLLSPEVRRALGPSRSQASAADWWRYRDLEFLERCQVMDLGNYLPDQVLVKVDRAAMRHSLEVRCPLLDQEVMEWAARAPASIQMADGGKALLKELAYRYVPKELLDRPKQGFAVPLKEWFRGELAPLMRRALADEASLTWRHFDRVEAQRRFERHLAAKADNSVVLWRLLFFDVWARRT